MTQDTNFRKQINEVFAPNKVETSNPEANEKIDIEKDQGWKSSRKISIPFCLEDIDNLQNSSHQYRF